MIRVSDHALVCFLDRVAGLDVEAVRRALAAGLARPVDMAERIGGGDYTIKIDGVVYVVKDGMLVTIMDRLRPAKRDVASEDADD